MKQGKKESTAIVRVLCFSLLFFLGLMVATGNDHNYDDPNSNGWLWLAGVLLMALGFFGAVVVFNNSSPSVNRISTKKTMKKNPVGTFVIGTPARSSGKGICPLSEAQVNPGNDK